MPKGIKQAGPKMIEQMPNKPPVKDILYELNSRQRANLGRPFTHEQAKQNIPM